MSLNFTIHNADGHWTGRVEIRRMVNPNYIEEDTPDSTHRYACTVVTRGALDTDIAETQRFIVEHRYGDGQFGLVAKVMQEAQTRCKTE